MVLNSASGKSDVSSGSGFICYKCGLQSNKEVLDEAGSISHKQAVDKALEEYRKFQVNNLSPVEKAYLETIKQLEKDVKKKK